jgi:hypothetical protein
MRAGTFQILSDSARISVEKKVYVLEFADMARVLRRERLHHPTAIEIFMANGRSYFLNFPGNRSTDIIRRLHLPKSVTVQKSDFANFFQNLSLTQKWTAGQISNFQYLMSLNIFGGRSFADPSQYPFLPWVIADYESASLDFSEESTFRDLSRPIGAVSDDRILARKLRLAEQEEADGQAHPFFNDFVICPLALYLWTFRMEPFATLHIGLQGGRFDHPSRLFSSIADAYKLVTTHQNHTRELSPEFYCQPEFLANENGFDLGIAHERRVDHVALPPWAHDSPLEFVYVMRKGLESERVSARLCEWIDLFFGCRQIDDPVHGLFSMYPPWMYGSIWTEETLSDPDQLHIFEKLKAEVGQVPVQLFSAPHPPRNCPKLSSVVAEAGARELGLERVETVFWKVSDRIELIVSEEHSLFVFTISFSDKDIVHKSRPIPVAEPVKSIVGKHASDTLLLLQTGQLLLCESLTPFYPEIRRISRVAASGDYYAIVSDEATLFLVSPRFGFAVPFFGDEIVCCDVSKRFRLAVCATASGTLAFCSTVDGTKVNVMNLEDGFAASRILITRGWGFVVTYGSSRKTGKPVSYVYVHSVNGRLIRKVQLQFPIVAWCTWDSRDGFDYLLVSTGLGKLSVCEAFYFDVNESFYVCHTHVASLTYLRDLGVAVAVTGDGRVIFVPFVIP